jgi:esterase
LAQSTFDIDPSSNWGTVLVDSSEAGSLEGIRRLAELHAMTLTQVALPEDCDVVIRRHRLHYLRWGAESAPTILFLHGATLTAHTWDLVALSLSDTYRCIAPDLRGHGDSEWSPGVDYELKTHADDVDAFIDHLGPGKIVLVGHSLGALIGILCAANRADLLSAIVIIDIGTDFNYERARKIRQTSRQRVELDSVDEFVEMAMQRSPRSDPEVVRGDVIPNLRKLPNEKLTWKYDRRQWEDEGSIDDVVSALSSAVPRVRCPALVVRGERSKIFTASDAELLSAGLAHAQSTEVPRAGHIVQRDNPRDLAQTIRTFLSEIGFDDNL